MAKFAIVLCMLIAACSGGARDSIRDEFDIYIQSNIAKYEGYFKKFDIEMAEYQDSAFTGTPAELIKEAHKEFVNGIEELVSSDQGSGSCISLGADFQNRLDGYVKAIKACSGDSYAEVQKGYAEVMAKYEVIKSALNQVKADYEKCYADMETILPCVTEVAATLRDEFPDKWSSVEDAVISYNSIAMRYVVSLGPCPYYSDLVEEAKDANRAIKKCLAGSKE